ncbi:early nodulin-12B-like [Portunus trituberculatus]|uniref:early nodulin-12B-like n=1 Tax=Portunus trituberculatus TaxID=210409 RepID=UPI001E1CC623|nr:early nodulin-12B-like [Portunus trituberculatus]
MRRFLSNQQEMSQANLAKEVLREIPAQLLSYMRHIHAVKTSPDFRTSPYTSGHPIQGPHHTRTSMTRNPPTYKDNPYKDPIQEPPYKDHPIQEPPYKDHPIQEPPYKDHPIQEPPYKDHPIQEPLYKDHPIQEPPYKDLHSRTFMQRPPYKEPPFKDPPPYKDPL